MHRIFELYTRDRLGAVEIAKQLRAEHAPAPAAGWGHPGIHFLLTNPTYTGKVRWRDQLFDAIHEPLIDQETFDLAQTILAERGEDISRRRGNPSDFLLSGVLRCGRCGKAYVGMSARGNGGHYTYYACSGRQKYGPKACDNQRLPREKLEQAVIDQLTHLYRDSTLIEKALADAQHEAEQRQPETAQQLAAIQAEIAHGEQALERYYQAFEHGKLTAERCEHRLTRLHARLDDLHAQHGELSLATPHEGTHSPTPADLAAVADHLDQLLTAGESRKTKALIRELVAELRVNSKAEIQPSYYLATPEVCATSEKVGRAGIEPATLGLKVPCSTN